MSIYGRVLLALLPFSLIACCAASRSAPVTYIPFDDPPSAAASPPAAAPKIAYDVPDGWVSKESDKPEIIVYLVRPTDGSVMNLRRTDLSSPTQAVEAAIYVVIGKYGCESLGDVVVNEEATFAHSGPLKCDDGITMLLYAERLGGQVHLLTSLWPTATGVDEDSLWRFADSLRAVE